MDPPSDQFIDDMIDRGAYDAACWAERVGLTKDGVMVWPTLQQLGRGWDSMPWHQKGSAAGVSISASSASGGGGGRAPAAGSGGGAAAAAAAPPAPGMQPAAALVTEAPLGGAPAGAALAGKAGAGRIPQGTPRTPTAARPSPALEPAELSDAPIAGSPETGSAWDAAPFALGRLPSSCSRAQSVVLGGSPHGSVSDLAVLDAEFGILVQREGDAQQSTGSQG
jgi:hypothetical protein